MRFWNFHWLYRNIVFIWFPWCILLLFLLCRVINWSSLIQLSNSNPGEKNYPTSNCYHSHNTFCRLISCGHARGLRWSVRKYPVNYLHRNANNHHNRASIHTMKVIVLILKIALSFRLAVSYRFVNMGSILDNLCNIVNCWRFGWWGDEEFFCEKFDRFWDYSN